MEDILCREFGVSSVENWYLLGMQPVQTSQYNIWQADDSDELSGLLYEQDQWKWCQENAYAPSVKQSESDDDFFQIEAARNLDPTHMWNVFSTAVSLFCFVLWICLSPHMTARGARLDITCKRQSRLRFKAGGVMTKLLC